MLTQVLEIAEMLDRAHVSGQDMARLLRGRGADDVRVETVGGDRGSTDFLRLTVEGGEGRSLGGSAPTLGVIGRLGGVGARPLVRGLVSDADGAIVALAVALKLLDLRAGGDSLPGDVIVATHVCPRAPVLPHDPVPFMSSPVDMETMNRMEVDAAMDAIVSVDTTRGNRIMNQRGFAISPIIKEGWVLRVPPALLDIMGYVTGRAPAVFAVATQDLTPYGNGLDHLNSILQPSTATSAPLLGVALTAETVVPGSASGATQEIDDEQAARFIVEVAKAFTEQRLTFCEEEEFARLQELYGSLRQLQTMGRGAARDR